MSGAIIRAELTNDIATADLCRALVDTGFDPKSRLDVYRGPVLALRVASIQAGAKLTIKEGNFEAPRLAEWVPFEKSHHSRPVPLRIAQTGQSDLRSTPSDLRQSGAIPDGARGRAA
jgi:hypothetical protein